MLAFWKKHRGEIYNLTLVLPNIAGLFVIYNQRNADNPIIAYENSVFLIQKGGASNLRANGIHPGGPEVRKYNSAKKRSNWFMIEKLANDNTGHCRAVEKLLAGFIRGSADFKFKQIISPGHEVIITG